MNGFRYVNGGRRGGRRGALPLSRWRAGGGGGGGGGWSSLDLLAMAGARELYPVVNIQCDWNEVLRTPNAEAWISAKYRNHNSTEGKVITAVSQVDNKVKVRVSEEYQYIAHTSLSLIVKHVQSGLKTSFVAPTKTHKVHARGVLSASIADNANAISSCENDKLLVWDSRTSKVLLTLEGHGGPVYKCRFFPSGVVALSAGADGSCRVWSTETGINPVTLAGHTMAVTDIAIVNKGRNVISVSKDGLAKLWDVGESKCLADITHAKGPINCCALAITLDEHEVDNEREVGTENKVLVVGCESGSVHCASVARREQLFERTLDAPCNACAALDDSFVVGLANGKLVQMSLNDGTILNEWFESASPVLSLVALPNDAFIAGRQDGTCTMFALQEQHRNVRVQLTGSDCDGIRDLAFNGKWILAACRDYNIRKYDINQLIVHFK